MLSFPLFLCIAAGLLVELMLSPVNLTGLKSGLQPSWGFFVPFWKKCWILFEESPEGTCEQPGAVARTPAISSPESRSILILLPFSLPPTPLQTRAWEIRCVPAPASRAPPAPSWTPLLPPTPTERSTAGRKAPATSKLTASRARLKVGLQKRKSNKIQAWLLSIPKSAVSSATAWAPNARGDCEELQSELVMVELNRLGHRGGEFSRLKCV